MLMPKRTKYRKPHRIYHDGKSKGNLELWGVNDLADSAVVYRVVVETEPMKQFVVERYLRKEIKKEFDQENIKIPYQQIEVHNGK